jgi:hypothetical protein
MAEWITTANGIITLITGLIGLIGTGVGAFFAIKNWITVLKTKSSQEIWSMIMSIADEVMKEMEGSALDNETKKKTVIDTVKTACKAAGINLDPFIDQLSGYIDDTIKFVRDMQNAAKK